MKRAVILLLSLLLLLSSCRADPFCSSVTCLKPDKGAEGEEPHPFLNDIVSECADRVDYLEFDSSSYERTYGIEFVVIHFSSDAVANKRNPYSYDRLRSLFKDNRVGTNYIIMRDGENICWLPEERCAWHAGRGTWNDDPKYENKMNLYSVGIELAAIGSRSDMSIFFGSTQYKKIPSEHIGYTDAQYASLAELIFDICSRNEIPMTREHIIGHEEYSPHKTDPGELFDWDRLMAELEKMK